MSSKFITGVIYLLTSRSTPLYQVLTHALADKDNKTKFTLLFANVAEKDILLREEFDELAKKFPETFKVVYYLDKAEKNWTGNCILNIKRIQPLNDRIV